MNQPWKDPQLGVLFIICLVTFIIAIYNLLCNLEKKQNKDSILEKLSQFRSRLDSQGIPSELIEVFEELFEKISLLEESKIDHGKNLLELLEGLEKKIKSVQDSSRLMEIKVTAVLENVVNRQKEIISARVDNKQVDDVIVKMKRIMSDKKSLTKDTDVNQMLEDLLRSVKKDKAVSGQDD